MGKEGQREGAGPIPPPGTLPSLAPWPLIGPRVPPLPFLKARNSKTLWTMDTMMVSARR